MAAAYSSPAQSGYWHPGTLDLPRIALMTIFARPASFEAAYSEHESDGDGVRVGEELWPRLRGEGAAERVCIAVQPLTRHKLPSLVSWASLDSKVRFTSAELSNSHPFLALPVVGLHPRLMAALVSHTDAHPRLSPTPHLSHPPRHLPRGPRPRHF
jgi:hypothetical protein